MCSFELFLHQIKPRHKSPNSFHDLLHLHFKKICIKMRVKVTGYRCVPRERARASGRAIPIQRNSTADTSCSEMFIYARARALIIIAIYNARVSAGAVKWQDKDRFDSCCTRNQPRHSIIVFIASQIPYNEIHFLTTSICTVIAA